MNNKLVAIRYDFDGYGYQYMDSGSGSDWQTRVKGEPLYTHPSEHDLGIAEAIGFEKGHESASIMLRQQQAEIEALKKENEELSALCVEFNVLRKAQEK